MSGRAKASGVSRPTTDGGTNDDDRGRGDSEPKTKKQRLLDQKEADEQNETDEELYQKAVALVFGGELYAKLLQYAGPEGIAHLRGDRHWRKAMDGLPADDLRALELPVAARPDDVDLALLRKMLTEPASAGLIGQTFGCWTLNELGLKILAVSPLTSNAVVIDLINSGNDELLHESISLRQGNSTKVLADLVRLGKPDLLVSIAKHQNASSEVLSAILLRLSGSKLPGSTVRTASYYIAKHENVGELDLDFLSRHEYFAVRENVAQNRSTPTCLLRKLSSDKSKWVRAAVARNRNTPRDTLISLIIDPSDVVRAAVARNPDAGLDLLFKLAMDDSHYVLESLAISHEKHFDLIFDEARKSHRPIIARYSDNSGALDRLVGMDEASYDSLVAHNSNAPQELLARLATSDNNRVRMGVAGNRNASAETLKLLLNDDACKWGVAGNENAPVHVLEALAKDNDISVVRTVAENESASGDILRGIISSNSPDSVPCEVFDNENLPLTDAVDFAKDVIEKNIELEDDVEDSLFCRLEAESDDLPVSFVVAMSKKDRLLFQRRAAACGNLPVKDILRLHVSQIEDIGESLKDNPLLQVAVDKLYHLLSSGGVGSGAHFTSGEKWW